MLHAVRSKKSHIGRLKQYTLGQLKWLSQQSKTIVKGSLTNADSKPNIQKQSGIEVKIASEQISTRQIMASKIGKMMKQPTFDWDTEDKYNELRNFRLEVYNVF